MNIQPYASEIEQFIKSPPGQVMLGHLQESRPPITGETLEQCAMTGRYAMGWEDAITFIRGIVVEQDQSLPRSSEPFNPIDGASRE